jgi:hypothetical protein
LYVNPPGSVSVTVIVPAVGAVPLLLTASVYVPVVPTVKFPVCDFLIVRTGAVTFVGSVAVAGFGEPPPDALAEFVTLGTAACATLTVRVIGAAFAPALITAAVVQVTTWPAFVHVQPVPVADANVRPAGSVSVTVTVPDVLTLPVLLTASVYTPGWPTMKLPVWDFVRASAELPVTFVGSLAVGEFVAPPPLAVAVLVTLPSAAIGTPTVSVIGVPLAPAAITALDVQVTFGAANAHVQPAPVADVKVKVAGKGSVTVIVPEVFTFPVLLTVMV